MQVGQSELPPKFSEEVDPIFCWLVSFQNFRKPWAIAFASLKGRTSRQPIDQLRKGILSGPRAKNETQLAFWIP